MTMQRNVTRHVTSTTQVREQLDVAWVAGSLFDTSGEEEVNVLDALSPLPAEAAQDVAKGTEAEEAATAPPPKPQEPARAQEAARSKASPPRPQFNRSEYRAGVLMLRCFLSCEDESGTARFCPNAWSASAASVIARSSFGVPSFMPDDVVGVSCRCLLRSWRRRGSRVGSLFCCRHSMAWRPTEALSAARSRDVATLPSAHTFCPGLRRLTARHAGPAMLLVMEMPRQGKQPATSCAKAPCFVLFCFVVFFFC